MFVRVERKEREKNEKNNEPVGQKGCEKRVRKKKGSE